MLIELAVLVLTALATATIGYWFGSIKFFREHQLRVYGEVLPSILKYALDAQSKVDEHEFNMALSKVWLYASRDVALKLDAAVSYRVDPSRGEFCRGIQSAIVSMRKDIIPRWFYDSQELLEEDIKHFYFKS